MEMLPQTRADSTLARTLRPRSVAVIGAGREPGGIGRAIFDNLLRCNFQGPVFPVNPHALFVASVQSYGSVLDIPGPVDLAVVAVPAEHVLNVAKECAATGVGGVVVISAGFAEVDEAGRNLQDELARLTRDHGMRMVGPNCLGVVNTDPAVSLNATFMPQPVLSGSVALLSQSGAVGIAAIEAATRVGLGLSSFVSVGNKADVSGNDLLSYWEHDEHTKIVMLYLESFGNPRRFSEIARRVARDKPIIAVKSGRSVAGVNAATSHTGAMATFDASVDALFHQAGVVRVDTVDEMVDAALVLDRQSIPLSNRVAIVGNAGGPAIMAADACEAADLKVAQLSGVTAQRLRMVLPQIAHVVNPFDLLAGAKASDYEAALGAVLADDEVDAVVVIYTRAQPGGTGAVMQAITTVSAQHPDKTVVGCFLGMQGAVTSPTIPCFRTVESAVLALGRVVRYAAWRRQPHGEVPQFDIDQQAARKTIERAPGGWLAVDDAAYLLGAYGIPVIASVLVDGVDGAVAAAETIGFPVVVKSADPDLVHKTDVGAVHVDLRTPKDVRAAALACAAACGGLSRLAVQPMVQGGVEVIIGIAHDERFGPLVMFGLGGIATELLADRAFRSVPMTNREAESLVREIRGHPLLFGYRGAPAVDVDALEEVLLRVAQLAYNVPELLEMDLNPVIVTPLGAVVVDAKVRLKIDSRAMSFGSAP